MNKNSLHGDMPAAESAETEATLLRIWLEVLNIENVGIDDDFLGLGGDSLTAMRCINRISAAFGVELPIDLFLLESVSVAQAASAVLERQLDAAHAAPPESV